MSTLTDSNEEDQRMNRDDPKVIEGMRRQSLLRGDEYAEAPRLGWKAGFGTEVAMAAIGTTQPLTGFLTTATLVESGSRISVDGWGTPLLEPEVAVRIGSELGPGASPEDAVAAVAAVAAAIEVVDLGEVDRIEEILAGNVFHRKVILGEFQESTLLDDARISVRVDGSDGPPSDPRDLIGSYGEILSALADQVGLIGELLQPGDVVITGAAVTPLTLGSGGRFEVSISGGSHVSVEVKSGT
jgi:2-keto-4-pentenoate hydratase